jgi:hypothetical protein
METHAQPLRQNRFALLRSLLARPWASRLVATLGIVVVTVGLYVPVAGRDLLFHGDPVIRDSDTWAIRNGIDAPLALLHLERMSVALQLGIEAMYAMLTLGGLALIPLLWQALSPRGTAAVRWIYALWLLLLALLAVAELPTMQQFMTQPPLELSPQPPTLAGSYLLPGAVVFPLGVLVSCVALALMFKEPPLVSQPVTAARTNWQWTAALVLTAGVLVWVIGFYLMPEAVTAACPPVTFSVTQFAHGACAGLDSDQVRMAASYAGLNPIGRLLFALGNNVDLLVALGCITALGGWTRQLFAYTLAWLAIWPLLALGVALVALQGVGVIAQQGFRLTAATGGGWHVASGMIVTFAGIGLVALGQLGLWREQARGLAKRRGSASRQ